MNELTQSYNNGSVKGILKEVNINFFNKPNKEARPTQLFTIRSQKGEFFDFSQKEKANDDNVTYARGIITIQTDADNPESVYRFNIWTNRISSKGERSKQWDNIIAIAFDYRQRVEKGEVVTVSSDTVQVSRRGYWSKKANRVIDGIQYTPMFVRAEKIEPEDFGFSMTVTGLITKIIEETERNSTSDAPPKTGRLIVEYAIAQWGSKVNTFSAIVEKDKADKFKKAGIKPNENYKIIVNNKMHTVIVKQETSGGLFDSGEKVTTNNGASFPETILVGIDLPNIKNREGKVTNYTLDSVSIEIGIKEYIAELEAIKVANQDAASTQSATLPNLGNTGVDVDPDTNLF